MDNEDLEEITPTDSLTPVFLDTTPLAPCDDVPDTVALSLVEQTAKDAAVAEIMANGYSENTARIMAGLPPLPA